MFTVPILLIIYHRPQLTARVFQEIRNIRPERLYIAADGAQDDRPGDQERVTEARKTATAVDWDCQVKTLFRDKNLGCKLGPSSAIDWFFQNEEEGIILEDDCLPHPTFFPYCQELLTKYRGDQRVMLISGDNFLNNDQPYSYYFSHYSHIWGWASWRRAWELFDINIPLWPQARDNEMLLALFSQAEARYWTSIFEATFRGEINDAWDYQWALACWLNNGLTVLPRKNLVKNIGLGWEVTHTKNFSKSHCPPVYAMEFPLRHPPYIVRNPPADKYTQKIFLRNPSSWERLRKLLHAGHDYREGMR